MSGCWICKQKSDWKLSKLQEARKKAKEYATINKITVAIWKEGSIYKWAEYTGQSNIELVSQY